MKTITGHIAAERIGNDMKFDCIQCGYTETVVGFANGAQPHKIVWQPTRFDGREYVKCEICGSLHDRVLPGAR